MINHLNPEGMPIHPQCASYTSADLPCTCESLYGYIGDNVLRAITVYEAQELRATPIIQDDEDLGLTSAERGLWKKSEELRCKAGLDFANGDMNMARYQTGTWQRARETQE